MDPRFRALSVAFLLLLLAAAALPQQLAQQPAQPAGPANEKELKRQRQRLQAISMVKQTAAEAPLWDNKKAAVLSLADAADLLWDENPGQGATWLKKAWDLIEQVSDSPLEEPWKEVFSHSDRRDVRTLVLRVARKHDQQLVEKFLKQLSQMQPDEKKDRGVLDDRTARSEQLLSLAWQVVETDPNLAFRLAEASLADGLSYNLQNLLTTLRKKSVPLSNQLFDLALIRFNSSHPDPSEADALAEYLFHTGHASFSSSTGQMMVVVNLAQQDVPPAAQSEPQRARGFLTAVYQNLLARPISLETPEDQQRAQRVLALGDQLVYQYNIFAPDLTPAAEGFLTQLRSRLSPAGDASSSAGTASRNTTNEDSTKRLTDDELHDQHVDKLEGAADNEINEISKRMAYVKAALATSVEDYKRGKRIAEKIDDADLRDDTISFVLYRFAVAALASGLTEQAAELSPQISNGPRRAVLKIALAQDLLKKSTSSKPETDELNLTHQKAFDLLNDIDRDFRKEGPSTRVAKIMLGRAAVLAKLDPAQSLAALEQAVQVINKLDKFDLRDSAAPNLSLAAAPSPETLWTPDLGFDFRSVIDPLIATHFEEVASVVERITTKEVAGVGRIEAAKLFLQKNPEKVAR
jgi:hypothetical protein